MSHFLKARHAMEEAPATSGHTIRWAYAYDFVVRVLSLNREGALRQETIRLARIDGGAAVLDVGCGTGTLTLQAKAVAGSGSQVYGIDAAPEMIARARRKARDAGVQVSFQVGVIEALQFADEMFDRVLSSLMMHHLPPELRARALAEIYRVLKPGGQVLIVDFDASAPRRGLAGLHRRVSVAEPAPVAGATGPLALEQLVRNAGFVAVEGGRLQSAPVAFVRGSRG